MTIAAEPPSLVPFRERLTCTIAEAARALGLCERTIYRLIDEGRVEAIKLDQGRRNSGRRLIRVRSLLRLIGEE